MKVRESLHLTTLCNENVLDWLVTHGTCVLDHTHNIHSFNNFAKNNVLVVQKRRRNASDEELAAICIRAGVLRDDQHLKQWQ